MSTYHHLLSSNCTPCRYHTQSEHLGVDAVDAIRGPVIVHPHGSFPQVDNSPLSYDYERILFFQAWSLLPSKVRYAQQISNSNGPVVKNEDGFVVSSVPWGFGTCNGSCLTSTLCLVS